MTARFTPAETETLRAATARRLAVREAEELSGLKIGGQSIALLTDADLQAFIDLHAGDEKYARHRNAAKVTLAARGVQT